MEITILSFLFILFSSIVFMNYIHAKWISFRSNNIKKSLPPSPQNLPIIGNFHQLDSSSPHRSLQDLSQKHGPIMLLHLGSIPMLIASSSKAAEEIMKTHDSSFASRPNSDILNILLYGCKDIAFAPNGEYWRQLKSIVVSNLLSNAQVKSFQKVREEEIGLLISSCATSSSVVDMSALLVSLAENIICRVALGKTLKLTNLLRRYLSMFNLFSVGSYIPWLSWVDRLSGLEGRAKAVVKEFDEFLEDVIEQHNSKESTTRGRDVDQLDFIDILLKLQKDKTTGFTFHRDTIKAVILFCMLDIFGGAIDSVSTSLEWILSELVKHPQVMKKLQKEVTEIAQGRSMICEEDLEKMQYLKCVIKESWRLHPPIPLLLPRKSTKEVKIMGYDIEVGTQAMVNVWAIGRDPNIWEESTKFKPERFVKNSGSISYKGLHFEWLPFGAGRRACPGTQFGVSIIELAIANIVYKFDLALPIGVQHEALDMSEKYGITVHRKCPLLLTPTPRI